jgi:hypothetical protein
MDQCLTPTLCHHTKLVKTKMIHNCIFKLKCVNNQLIDHLSNHDKSNVINLFLQNIYIWMGEHDHMFT